MSSRLSIHQLKEKHDKYIELKNKVFIHNKSGEKYQLLFTAFSESENEVEAIYCLCTMPWLKFTRPISEFLNSFSEGH